VTQQHVVAAARVTGEALRAGGVRGSTHCAHALPTLPLQTHFGMLRRSQACALLPPPGCWRHRW
jgi:hypothetical protein